MKPFNLEQVLAGKPVVTRDGKSVTQLTRFDLIKRSQLTGVLESKDIHTWEITGQVSPHHLHDHDLFMASEKKSGWIAICKPDNNSKCTAYCRNVFATLEEVKEICGGSEWKYIKIEWDE